MRTSNKLTATNLRDVLWQTLQGVRLKKVSPQVAGAVARTTSEILRTVKTEISVANHYGEKVMNGSLYDFAGIVPTTAKKLPRAKKLTNGK